MVITIIGIPGLCVKYNTQPSLWWGECSGCLYQGNPRASYEKKGRRELMRKLKLA